MSGSLFIGRVGGLAIALGIGAAIANGCGDASADATQSSTSSAPSGAAAAPARPPASLPHSRASRAEPEREARRERRTSEEVPASKPQRGRISLSGKPSGATVTADAVEAAPSKAAVSKRGTQRNGPLSAGLSAYATGLGGAAREARAARADVAAKTSPTIFFNLLENVGHADGTVSGKVHASDADGDRLTYSVGRPLRGGSVKLNADGVFTYTPSSKYRNSQYADSFTVTVREVPDWSTFTSINAMLRGWPQKATTTVTVTRLAVPTPTPPPTTSTPPPASSGPQSAATKFGWGAPSASVNFSGQSALNDWWVYDAPGNGGQGWRTPKAVTFADNSMVITGDAAGNTGGMMWQQGQKYGAWEVQMKVPPGAKDYNAVALLWPSTDRWPADGEIDFMELKNDATRHNVTAAMHYSKDGKTDAWVAGAVDVDAAQWHNYAVVWTPTRITTYVDGVAFFTTTDVAKFPSTSMQLCLQLDYAGSDLAGGAQLQIASAKMYSLAAVTAGTTSL